MMLQRAASPTSHLAFDLPAHRASVSTARHRVSIHLAYLGCRADTCETALLLVSELFTNALLHTASTTIGCTVRAEGTHLRIEVHDQGGGAPLSPGLTAPDAVRGRGLLIVENLSTEWGVSAGLHGQTVWCDLPQA
jgi:anti-sigma regulatory factor (Ser/Thr protein kinase)